MLVQGGVLENLVKSHEWTQMLRLQHVAAPPRLIQHSSYSQFMTQSNSAHMKNLTVFVCCFLVSISVFICSIGFSSLSVDFGSPWCNV